MAGKDEDQLRLAVEMWREFPARSQVARPLVLVGPWLWGFEGFEDSASGDAFERGKLLVAAEAPQGELFAMADREVPPVPVATDPALRIDRAEQVRRYFWTDRGPRLLPAWELRLAGKERPIRVLDHSERQQAWSAATWLAARCMPGVWATVISGDGMTLRYTFEGAPPDRTEYPDCRVLETESAVALQPEEALLSGPASRPTGMYRLVEARLREPLGDRVLLTDRGLQVPVTSDGSDPWADRRPLDGLD
jgi:hypothetical protein